MSLLYLAGRYFNAYSRGTVTCSPSAASVSAASNIGNGRTADPLLFGSLAADSYVQVTLNALTNPSFETPTLSGWTDGSVGTGTSAETTTAGEFRTGSRALKLTGSSAANYGSRHRSITANAGEYRKATVYIKTPSSGSGKLFIRNLKTGNYYNGSAWASTRAAAVTQAATGSFVAMTVTYQVESFATCLADTVSLRVECACESGTVCFDDTLDVPGVTWASIHGHNLGPVVPTVRSSDDGSSWTDRATMTIRRPAFFTTFSIIYAEYWRIVAVGTNHETPYLGEAVLGQYQTSATPCLTGPVTTYDIPGVRAFNGISNPTAYNYCTDPRESVRLEFSADSATAALEHSYGILARSGQGAYPVIVATMSTEDAVYYGRIANPLEVSRPLKNMWDLGFNFIGDPFPTVGL